MTTVRTLDAVLDNYQDFDIGELEFKDWGPAGCAGCTTCVDKSECTTNSR